MRDVWIDHCLAICKKPADLYCGSRKIIRNIQLTFPFECDLEMSDAGYTPSKMKQLERNYLHQESIDAAIMLWDRYRSKPKYRSVSFTCYNHFVKDHHGPRGSVMGPCLQSVVITMLNKREADINVLYRTTEFFKKFPADLIFLKERLIPGFNFDGMTVRGVNCFFSNLTAHPAYFVTVLPHLADPIAELEILRKKDPYFWQWCVKWTSRYLIEKYGHGIQKFSQAVRVQMYAQKNIIGTELIELQEYLERNHPGYKGLHNQEYAEEEEDEDVS